MNKTNEKGITMMTLIIYIIVMLIVLGILATLNKSYRAGIVEMRTDTTLEAEYSKLNLYLLEEAKKTNNGVINSSGETITSYSGDSITLKSGSIFSWEDLDEDGIYSIYLEKENNEKFEIAYNISKNQNTNIFQVSQANNGKTKITLTVSLNNNEKITEYILSNQETSNIENEIDYYNFVNSSIE